MIEKEPLRHAVNAYLKGDPSLVVADFLPVLITDLWLKSRNWRCSWVNCQALWNGQVTKIRRPISWREGKRNLSHSTQPRRQIRYPNIYIWDLGNRFGMGCFTFKTWIVYLRPGALHLRLWQKIRAGALYIWGLDNCFKHILRIFFELWIKKIVPQLI